MPPRPIYSHKILSGALFSGPIVYTNTPGQVTVIRSIDGVNAGGPLDRVAELYVNVANTIPFWTSPLGRSLAGEHYGWSGRQCLEDSDELQVLSADPNWTFIASGYILTP